MKGIMVLAHGSRVKETTDTIEKIVMLAKDNADRDCIYGALPARY